MNRQKIIEKLMEILGDLDLHDRFIAELIELIVGSGYEPKLFKLFLTRLASLSRFGVDVVKQKEFEPLGGGLFSMHLAGHGFNIRVLFSFLPNGDPSLLLCFYEREGKKNTDYSPYIKPAQTRFLERMEEFENGEKQKP